MCMLDRCLTWCIIAVIGPVHAYFLCHRIGSRFFIGFTRLMIRVSCIDNSVKCNHAAHQVNQCTSIILHQISSMIPVSVKKTQPPKRNTLLEISLENTKSGAGKQLLPLDCMAKAGRKGVFFSWAPVSLPITS